MRRLTHEQASNDFPLGGTDSGPVVLGCDNLNCEGMYAMSEQRMYRGKRVDGGEWVKGWYQERYTVSSRYETIGPYIEWIEDECAREAEVIPSSVGQSTGRKDDEGNGIYANDILRSFHFRDKSDVAYYLYHIVQWSIRHDSWMTCAVSEQDKLEGDREGSPPLWVYMKNSIDIEVIGNTTDNPELLENDK